MVDAYDQARPGYPEALFDALAVATRPLAGAVVLEGGAGTGLATAALTGRGARVVAFDVGERMLQRTARRAPAAALVVADGNALPFAAACADLLCFAQAWHWLDLDGHAQDEAARVLRPGGWWAGWWSHPRADGEDWFDRYQSRLEEACSGYGRAQRDVDWGHTLLEDERFEPARKDVVAWTRRVDVATWLVDEQSKSYVAALDAADRDALLRELREVLRRRFPTGELAVPYETWLWTARLRDTAARTRGSSTVAGGQ
jgi:SAM-dependent methyltransferase